MTHATARQITHLYASTVVAHCAGEGAALAVRDRCNALLAEYVRALDPALRGAALDDLARVANAQYDARREVFADVYALFSA